jgi:hypothetical protein
MDTQDLTLQGIASVVFVAAGTFIPSNWIAFAGLAILAVAILALKGYLASKGIAALGKK